MSYQFVHYYDLDDDDWEDFKKILKEKRDTPKLKELFKKESPFEPLEDD